MAKIQCRNLSTELYEAICKDACAHERSIERHVRFLLTQAMTEVNEDKPELPDWIIIALKDSAKKGFRNLEFELIKRLTKSLAEDGYSPPKEKVNENALHLRLVK